MREDADFPEAVGDGPPPVSGSSKHRNARDRRRAVDLGLRRAAHNLATAIVNLRAAEEVVKVYRRIWGVSDPLAPTEVQKQPGAPR